MKSVLKMFVSLLIVLLIAVPVFANGSTEGGNGDTKTITFLSLSTQGNGIKAAFEEYQKTHPDVELDLVPCTTVTDFETVMTGYIAAGTLPDMYLTQIGAVQQEYAANGYVRMLGDTGVMENVVPGDSETIMYNGDYFTFPLITEGVAITVNNEVIKEAGIVLDETHYPRCFSEFLEMLDQLVAAGIQYPIAIAGKDASSVTSFAFQYIYQVIYGKDPNWYANLLRGEHTWNDELYLDMFEKYGQLKPYISPNCLGMDQNGVYRAVISGESPIMFGALNVVASIRQIAPDLDVLCLPSCFTDDPADQTIILGYGDGVSICSTTDIPDVCIGFLKYLASDEGSTIYGNATQSILATKENHVNSDPANDIVTYIMQNETLPVSPMYSRQWIPGVKEVMKTAQQNWFAGADAQTVCDEIQAQHDRLVAANPDWVKNFLDTYTEK